MECPIYNLQQSTWLKNEMSLPHLQIPKNDVNQITNYHLNVFFSDNKYKKLERVYWKTNVSQNGFDQYFAINSCQGLFLFTPSKLPAIHCFFITHS